MAATPSSSSPGSRLLQGPPPPEPEKTKKQKTEKEEDVRDWAELPRDALLLVLEKLSQVDVFRGPELVCGPWRRAALDEPTLWRHIDLRHCHVDASSRWCLRPMAHAAVRRSRGCEALRGEGAVDEWVISLLENSPHSLKSLRMISCERITDRLSNSIPWFYKLEELEISNCDPGAFSSTCIVVGNSCPNMKRFRLSSPRFYKRRRRRIDCEVEGITRMRGLRSLQLFAQTISTDGLSSILNSCVQLESLDIRHCFNIEMEEEMVARCSRFRSLKLPYDSTHDYDLEFSAPDMRLESPRAMTYEDYHGAWGSSY
ncbi:putative F-box/LRR-repeat protein 23 [Brachypodium distachyon]|uniref:putative F-box/LRR-repeat protein 23 n=1 Tax=Brachypodium distachyon TaxID=15368 RepID=UPI0001C6FA97|nr:putative F-box/LRR-repeat protein 23 [Brachypodium distachyon]|eukprot:XP_003580962.3 putative F-box/LRR-repeat protein 23 [Brachypodium distachyon]